MRTRPPRCCDGIFTGVVEGGFFPLGFLVGADGVVAHKDRRTAPRAFAQNAVRPRYSGVMAVCSLPTRLTHPKPMASHRKCPSFLPRWLRH
jgi:hypothetical protein